MGARSALKGVYLDASAAVKLLRAETETEALDAFLVDRPLRVSSELLRVELACVCHRQGISGQDADELLGGLRLLPVTASMLNDACEPFTPPQRALDAIHLATALHVREQLGCLVTYDDEQAAAATARGLSVEKPS